MVLRRWLSVLLVSLVTLCAPLLLPAQEAAPKFEAFGGYSWYHPGGTVNNSDVSDFNSGWAGEFIYNVNHWAGVMVDGAGHYNDFGNAHTVTFGPQFRLRTARFTPFAEALVGVQLIAPKNVANETSATFMFGGGLDYPVSRRFSIRPIQVDYVNSSYDKGAASGTTNTFNGVRLQAGLVVNLGLPSENGPVSADCSAEPQAADAGVPVRIGVTARGFPPTRTLSYSYASNGGKIAGTTTTGTVDTTGVAPGNYKASAKVVENGGGRHPKTASCVVDFTINEAPKHPPVLSVSADPTSLQAGDSSTITATGSSPDNRPLSYNCTSTGGRLTGNGPTFTLETAGVAESTIVVNCTVSDDRSLNASADASVKVNAVKVAPETKAWKYGTIEFQRDAKRPTRVDNEAKGELDRYVDALAAEPDAKGVVVGYATAKENTPKKGSKTVFPFAALRAVNTKDYVVKDQGIDGARIQPRTGSGDGQKVELWIVPAGATFPAEGTTVVDEATVKSVPRVALKTRKAGHHRK